MADPKPMPSKDRSALKSVIKQRFEILEQQLIQRQQEVRETIRKEIEKHYEGAVKDARKETEDFQKRAVKIEKEIAAFLTKTNEKIEALVAEGKEFGERMEANGLTNNGRHYTNVVEPVVNNLRQYLYHNWTGEGWENGQRVININNGWMPAGLDSRVQEAYSKIATQAGMHKLDLKMQELEITEELLVGGISSEEGRAFLSKIPTIDNLLPAPTEAAKAIEATISTEE